jgi:hypothetical protein
MRRSLYDRYARPYGLKTAALEKDYATWRAHGALFWAGTLLTVYVDPVIGALLLPWLLKALSWSNRNALWSVDDLVKPPWRRPVPPQTRTLSF